ncbi:hypothetical protein AZO1586I_536 [Bathymodiolus thermophilus thioautotrophic gill symbiont]|uniref:Uncharacterized protein n=1 Tax=Bathymodiolus thermophilus thioautotrophic gill symbiont TaxID=2360 RepID=A0ABN7G8Y4_9GAMM|nr:hypothetical protein AZO1586I_536 [Bathymodiolus thermophilus thioautotrophic gill symbiont]CAC5830900.1 hypothetical protein [uncultured Gammaproteobacteria bacterium]CAC9994891.1 hypothetical protein [uncultured Gammaproteobacteria bacterium]CAC9996641.1 hypothetical protein [uncultured Gammaproteobacteria bacterium]
MVKIAIYTCILKNWKEFFLGNLMFKTIMLHWINVPILEYKN